MHSYHLRYFLPKVDNKLVQQWPPSISVFKEERGVSPFPGELHGEWERENTKVDVWFSTALSMNELKKELEEHDIYMGNGVCSGNINNGEGRLMLYDLEKFDAKALSERNQLEKRKQDWRRLDYCGEDIPGPEFDHVLKLRIGNLEGLTDAKAVAMTGFGDGTPPDVVRSAAEKVKTAKLVMHKWRPLIRAMKSALPDTKLSKKRREIFLVDVVVELLSKEMCMLIIYEEVLDGPVIACVTRFVLG